MTRYVQSPLNYTGGKYKLLPQILPLFPDKISTFVDLFCGGANVGVNIDCANIIFNDSNSKLIDLLSTLKNYDFPDVFDAILAVIDRYGLSKSYVFGYNYYNCDSAKGLGEYNREPFNRLKADFNNRTEKDFQYYIMLYVLVVYAFNNQIRFNANGEYNLPVGKRDFNQSMQNKLKTFLDKIKTLNCCFTCRDYKDVITDSLAAYDFVYVDPPYLITCASYNENNGWSDKDEVELLLFLEHLHSDHIRFALSNVLESKGNTNHILYDWLQDNPYLHCHVLNFSYTNSNYHLKSKNAISKEVLITNY